LVLQAVNGSAANFLQPLRRGVSATGPCATVLFRPSVKRVRCPAALTQ